MCCVLFPQDGVDGDSIFDSTDLDGRQSRAETESLESLERAWDRICTNYQNQLDMEGLNDVVPQVD